MNVLNQLARGCVHRLRAIVRENITTGADVNAFMANGTNRLVMITDLDPEEFVDIILSGDKSAIEQIKAVAISSNMVQGTRTFLVMSVNNGRLGPIGAPTENFIEAFNYLETAARNEIGPDGNNLVFYIDEDLPCPDVPGGLNPLPSPMPIDDGGLTPLMPPKKEKCCGRRY